MSLENILPEKIIKRSLVTCEPNTSLHQASRLMKQHNVGCLVVIEQGIPKGMLTDRDICVRAIAHDPTLSLADPVRLIMTSPVRSISLQSGLQDAIRIMKSMQIRRLPVVDSMGKAIGILTFSDVYALLSNEMKDLNSIISAGSGFEFGEMVA